MPPRPSSTKALDAGHNALCTLVSRDRTENLSKGFTGFIGCCGIIIALGALIFHRMDNSDSNPAARAVRSTLLEVQDHNAVGDTSINARPASCPFVKP